MTLRVIVALLVMLSAVLLEAVHPACAQGAPTNSGAPLAGKGGGTPTAAAPNTSNVDILILEARLRSFLLTDELLGFIRGSSLMLPLGQLSRALDFAIKVDGSGERASGWFIRENRLFSLSVARGEVVINGKGQNFDRAMVDLREGDIFVDVRLLATWFPIDIEFDLANLLVKITSREPLPVEERLEREQERARLGGNRGVKQFPRQEIPYKAIRPPVTDVSIDGGIRRNEGTYNGFRDYSALSTGDVAGLSAETYVSGNDNQPFSAARLKVGRTDPDTHLLGPLDASEFAVGDITSPKIPLVSSVRSGRGVSVTNLPVNTPTEFDRITLEGNLLSGWEVELYRNEVLLDFRASQPDGRYRFVDVPLLFGVNVLRLVFYGPQGQRREETRQVRVGPDQVRPGETNYRMAATQEDQPFIGHGAGADPQDVGHGRYFAEVERGLTQNLSLAANVASIPRKDTINTGVVDDDNRQNFFGLSTRAFIGDVAGRLDIEKDASAGTAGTAAAQTTLFGFNLIGDYSHFWDYSSEDILKASDPLLDRTNVRIEGILNPPILPRLPFNIRSTLDRRQSGDYEASLSNRTSFAVSQMSVTNDSTWLLHQLQGEHLAQSTGVLSVGGLIDPVRVRGQINYETVPDQSLQALSLTGEWDLSKIYGAKLGVEHDLDIVKRTSLTGGLNAQFDGYQLGSDVFVADNGDWGIRFGINFSFGYDPKGEHMFLKGHPIATSGALSSKVFLDNNHNGVYDTGDEPLKNVSVALDGQPIDVAKTDDDGNLLLTDLTPNLPVNIGIADGTLEDPYWLADPEGVQLVPRPGVIATVDFPIIQSGEIDGTVYQRRGDWAGPISDAIVQLVDAKGTVVRTTKSAYDGFYIFEFVRPGAYAIRIDPQQLSRLGIDAPAPKPATIETNGTIIKSQDFVLSGQESEINYRVQLNAFANREAADAAWEAIVQNMPDAVRGLQRAIEQSATPSGQVAFVLYAEDLNSRDAAEKLCTAVRGALGATWCNPLLIEVQ